MIKSLLAFVSMAAVAAQQCGTDPQAPICSKDEDCCKDSASCTGACTECCVRQSTFCVPPRSGYTTSTCCARWTVGCTVGSVGCCDPATPWQFLGSASTATTTGAAAAPSTMPFAIRRKPTAAYRRPTIQLRDEELLASPTPAAAAAGTGGSTGGTAFALFPQPFGNSFNALTIDLATGNTTKKAVKGPAAAYYGHYYGESSRVFPWDAKTARFVFADVDLTQSKSATALTAYTIDPKTGASTAKPVQGCSGYPYGLAFDAAAGHLVVGLKTETTAATFCAVDPDSGTGKVLSTVAKASGESSPAYYAAFLSHVHDGVAYRVGHKMVTTGSSPGYSVTKLGAAAATATATTTTTTTTTTEWRSVPLEATHDLPATIKLHPKGGYVSLAPRKDATGSFDVVRWDDGKGTAELVGNFTNSHMPTLSIGADNGKPLGYVADAVSGNTFASMTVALHPGGILPGVADKWTLSTVDLETGDVKELPLTPQPSIEGAETVSLSGFGVAGASQ